MANSATQHQWRFFRAGGFDQVRLDSGADLAHLDQLDQKLWVALACPIAGLDFDLKTAALVDTDNDGRIRAPELIAAVQWACAALKSPGTLVQGGDSLSLGAISDASEHGRQIFASARHLHTSLGQPPDAPITLAQVADANRVFAAARFNGDGIIVPECADEPAIATVITEIADCLGSINDRSGKPGVDQERVDKFFEACVAYDNWLKLAAANAPAVLPAGAGTAAAAGAVKAVKAKVDDYFGRCRLAAFDPRSAGILNRVVDDYLAITTRELSIDATAVATFPLAQVAAGKPLPLRTGLNPAHAVAVGMLLTAAVRPLLGDRAELTEADWAALQNRLVAYEAWDAAKTGAVVEKLGAARVRALLDGKIRARINDLIARDKAVEAESANAANVEKLLRYVRDLYRLCHNFVNFKDLYLNGGPAIFQCGTLYVDERACSLCLTVEDAGRHAAMAALSGAYLAYCDCVRKGTGEKLSIVAIVSQGDDENLMVGRNGIFYDRTGRDYDATITKIVASPISLRQAFFSPYKKLARAVEEYIAKRASALDTTVQTQLTTAVTTAPAAAAPAKPLFDPSVVALLSVAVGSLLAGATAVLAFLGKVPLAWLPLVLLGIALAVSAPSLLLAFIKLRKRNLGPILDANGWAINAKAKINVPFGERLTVIAHLPKDAIVDTHDSYAEVPALWPKIVIATFLLWYLYIWFDYSGYLFLLTRDWETPLGQPPANYRVHTNQPPAVIITPTNAPAK